jgi:serine/threonine protein phosphatase PrpC
MAEQDWMVVLVLCVAAAAIAFVLGRRQRAAAMAAAAVPPPEPEAEPQPKPQPEPDAQKKTAIKDVARVDYEEDDDIDPTKVGTRPSGPATAEVTIYQPPLKRIIYDEDAERDEPTQATSLFLVHATAQTDPGLRRKRNEDALLVSEKDGLFVIADGMGGYQGGALASSLAVKTIGEAFAQREFEGPPHEGVPADATNLARAIQMANAAILEVSKQKKDLEGMGTTVCAARFSSNKKRLFIGHVGDSRCYRLRDGIFKQMTADHTMADLGVAGPESTQLSRAVGIWPTVPIDVLFAQPEVGDAYLLCSDGLTKMLTDDLIANVIRHEDDPQAAVDRLIFFSNSRGGKDNITVILVRVVPPDWKAAPSKAD